MNWEVIYSDHLQDWLDQLDKQKFQSLAKELRLLEMCGSNIRLPHSKSLGGGLFELRERNFDLRIYYCYGQSSTILLLHAGNKHFQSKDIKKARILLELYRQQNL